MDEKPGEKSRRERRKESRLAKNKKKFDSWVQHQQSSKSKKSIIDVKSDQVPKLPKNNAIKDYTEPPNMMEKSESKLRPVKTKKVVSVKQSIEQPSTKVNSNVKTKDLKRKKSSTESSKSKFSKFLEMDMGGTLQSAEEDLRFEQKLAKKLKVKNGKLKAADDDMDMLLEGIPSFLDGFGEIEERKTKGKKREDVDFQGKGKKGNSVKEESEDEILFDEDDEKSDSLIASSEDYDNDDDNDDDIEDDSNLIEEEEEEMNEIMDDSDIETPEPVKTSAAELASKKLTNKVAAKYVAPHLRSSGGSESEEYAQIRKRLRGLLNRLSETNVESITGQISTLLQSVSRSVGSQILSEEIVSSCSGGPRGNEQYAAVFASFVAGMACSVGIDFGAKILERLAECFEEEYSKEDNLSLRNLTLLFSFLYVFGVCSSELIYDFLLTLSKRLTEVDVSTVLTVLQCCGMKLRGDDPVGMKNFISSVQNRVSELKASYENGQSNTTGKRMEFMLETICDIKNNKKRTKEDTVQHTRIKKWLQKLRVEDISLRGLKWSKLLDPTKKGQWWLSGDIASTNQNIDEVSGTIDLEVAETKKMLQLAAAQRMNTDARKAIFCVIMSGEDYMDAFEKLLRLDLPGKQDREIMRVLVECCLQEKVFNKYYCLLAWKLCKLDKNHKFTLQYCLWDHFKELESMPLIRSMHLAKFTAQMIASFSLSLSVLKVVDLNDTLQLTPKRIMHFRVLFEAVFEFSDKLIWNIFTRIAITPEYETLRSGIEFFIKNYVVSSEKSLEKKFKIARKALNNFEGTVM